MKKLGLLALLLIVGVNAYADEIIYFVPRGTSSVSGRLEYNNCVLRDIRMSDTGKQAEVNYDKNLFLVYGLSADDIRGSIVFDVDRVKPRYDFNIETVCASGLGEELGRGSYSQKEWTYKGVKKKLTAKHGEWE